MVGPFSKRNNDTTKNFQQLCIVYQITQLADYEGLPFFALLFNIHAKSYSTLHLFFIPYGIPGMVMLLLCEVGTHLSDGSSFFLRTPSEFPSYSMASNSQVSDFGTGCVAFPSASIYAQSVGWSKFQKFSQ